MVEIMIIIDYCDCCTCATRRENIHILFSIESNLCIFFQIDSLHSSLESQIMKRAARECESILSAIFSGDLQVHLVCCLISIVHWRELSVYPLHFKSTPVCTGILVGHRLASFSAFNSTSFQQKDYVECQ